MKKGNNIKNYKYNVKAVAVNGALQKVREILLVIDSTQEDAAAVQRHQKHSVPGSSPSQIHMHPPNQALLIYHKAAVSHLQLLCRSF